MTFDADLQAGTERFLEEETARWEVAGKAAAEDRERFRDAIRAAHGAGISEYRIAAISGVTRKTVRTWVGK